MMFIIQFVTKHQFSGTKPIGDTVGDGKVVKPHNNEMKKVGDHQLGKVWVGKGADMPWSRSLMRQIRCSISPTSSEAVSKMILMGHPGLSF